jgi:hypothetical protein
MSQSILLRSLAFFFLSACVSQEAKQPNPLRPIDERRAIPIIAQAYADSGETASEGRDIRLPTGKPLRVDVGTVGHKYGIAYLTTGDLSGLDAKTDLPPHTSEGDLPVVQGSGADGDAVILVLYATDYQYDDLAGEQHESTTITAEKKLARDVRDFLVQARARKLP